VWATTENYQAEEEDGGAEGPWGVGDSGELAVLGGGAENGQRPQGGEAHPGLEADGRDPFDLASSSPLPGPR